MGNAILRRPLLAADPGRHRPGGRVICPAKWRDPIGGGGGGGGRGGAGGAGRGGGGPKGKMRGGYGRHPMFGYPWPGGRGLQLPPVAGARTLEIVATDFTFKPAEVTLKTREIF